MNNSNKGILVSIRCAVYNHEPFLRQCLDGFVMQKTNFAFEAIVHDDASTDNSAAIIREYAEKFPDIIKPIYETENQYSKKDGSLTRIMDAAISPSSKYIAICEGDDYWIDPLKLQKQVDFLETHPDYTMVCCRSKLYSEKDKRYLKEKKEKGWFFLEGATLEPKDIIGRGGYYISTCGILFRKVVRNNYPDYCSACFVGDYPLQILCAMKGRVYCFAKEMVVYRVNNSLSWTGRQRTDGFSEKRLSNIRSFVNMYKGFMDEYTQYRGLIKKRMGFYLNMNIPVWGKPENPYNRLYFEEFHEEMAGFDFANKLYTKVLMMNNNFLQLVCLLFVRHVLFHKYLMKIL